MASLLSDLIHDNHPFGLLASDSRLDDVGDHLEMPEPDEYGLVQTKNHGVGYMHSNLEEINNAFVSHVSTCKNPVLEIGCAYGSATLPALANSTCPYVAADLGEENLLILRNRTSQQERERLYLKRARFPNDLEFEENSIDAVLISRVLHFLRGEEVELGLKKIYKWLKPDGKLFLLTCTPYTNNLREFLPIYEERWSKGVLFPGHIENLCSISGSYARNLTDFLNVMDKRALQAVLARVGFITEMVDYISYYNEPPEFYLDGREHIGAIVLKPK